MALAGIIPLVKSCCNGGNCMQFAWLRWVIVVGTEVRGVWADLLGDLSICVAAYQVEPELVVSCDCCQICQKFGFAFLASGSLEGVPVRLVRHL